MSEERIPCIPGLFSENDGVAQIHGSRCASCRTPYFPKSAACHNPDCGESKWRTAASAAVVYCGATRSRIFPPPAPHKFDKPFKPYAVGVADLDCGLRVVGQMVDPPDQVQVGSGVELVIDTLYHEDDKAFTSWKFRQIAAPATRSQ
ncbi:MAG: OB-fold domain-containing protein [Gammaproteobacteria bacterium]|nr:OB-fold domain-containing protein [Gammaproteobacteria bacterium]